MDTEMLEYYKNKLLSLKGEYRQTEESVETNNSLGLSEREQFQELSFYDNHPADLGTEVFLREISHAKMDNIKNTLKLIDEALNRIEAGRYGVCTVCGESIERERLEAIPYTMYCIKCAKEHEQLNQNNVNTRLSEESNYPHGFGDLNLDYEDENVEFDGEDMYQELERFNKTQDPSLQTGDQIGMEDEMNLGAVEPTDNISNDYYKNSLKDDDDTGNEDV